MIKCNLLFLFILCPLFLRANDGYSAIGAGGIVFTKTDRIAMESEVLTISENDVNVKYEYVARPAESEKDGSIKAVVAFPMPLISCGYWGKGKELDDFTVLVDGKKIDFKKQVKAFKDNEDVSAQVTKAGLPLDCRKLDKNKKLFKKAQKKKWAQDYQGTDPEDVLYKTQIIYYWEQEFPASKTVKIEHTYTPIWGQDLYQPNWFFNMGAHWDRDVHSRWEGVNSQEGRLISDVASGKSVQYILTTAKTWWGGASRFQLILKKNDPATIIGSTLGPLKALDKNTFEFRAHNFSPDRELTVFFGKAAEKSQDKKTK